MKKKVLKAIILFFIIMVCCTFVARGASAMMAARVKTEKMKSGQLERYIEGDGVIQASDKSFQSLPEGQKVARVLVTAGTKVEKGQAVVKLDMDYLDERIKEQKREVEKTKLELEQMKLTSKREQKKLEDEMKNQQEEEQQGDISGEKAYQKKLSSLQQESLQITLNGQKEKLQKLEEIKGAEGIVSSDNIGIFESVGVTEGTVTTGSEQITLESGSMEICAHMPEDNTVVLKEGSEVEIRIPGEAEAIKVTLERFGKDSEGNDVWYGTLPSREDGEEYRLKTSVTYVYREKTVGKYNTLISLSALRQEQNLTYVLTAEMRSGILGENYTAVKVPVNVIDKDDENAAVQTVLPGDAMIISGSNKYVEEGDRVRLDG